LSVDSHTHVDGMQSKHTDCSTMKSEHKMALLKNTAISNRPLHCGWW